MNFTVKKITAKIRNIKLPNDSSYLLYINVSTRRAIHIAADSPYPISDLTVIFSFGMFTPFTNYMFTLLIIRHYKSLNYMW